MNRTNDMYSSEDLKKVVEAVISGKLSLREASKIYNIPKSTIADKKDAVIIEKQKRGPSTTLTNDEEKSFVLYIQVQH